MDISCIILTWNSENFIGNCIQTILNDLLKSEFEFEILIVDNGSNDGTPEYLKLLNKSHPSLVKPIFLKENTGTTRSRNIALKKAKGSYICIADSDVEINIGCFEKLINFIDKKDEIGLIAPRIKYPSGKIQKSADNFPTIISKSYRYFFLRRIENLENKIKREDSPVETDYLISAFWLFKKNLLEEVGYLDENIFYAPEDLDYCLRIWKKGYKIFYYPQVEVVHHAQEISRGFKINKILFEHAKGLLYYFRKHNYILFRPNIK